MRLENIVTTKVADLITGGAISKRDGLIGTFADTLGVRDTQLQAIREAATTSTAVLLRDTMSGEGWLRLHTDMSSTEPDWETRIRYANAARDYWLADGVGAAAVRLTTDFTFGTGFLPPRAKRGDLIDTGAQDIIRRFWKDPKNARMLFGRAAQKRADHELQLTGNLWILGNVGIGSNLRITLLPHDEFTKIIVDPNDGVTPLWYVREFTRETPDGSGTQHIRVYMDKNADPEGTKDPGESAEREEALDRGRPFWPQGDHVEEGKGWIMHVKGRALPHWRFGVSSLSPIIRWLDMLKVAKVGHSNRVRAADSVFFREKVTGTGAAISHHAAQARADWKNGYADQEEKQPYFASTRVEPPGRELEVIDTPTRANEGLTSTRVLLHHVAAGSGFGMHILGDPGASNLATAESLEQPTKLMVESRHEEWADVFEELTWAVLEAGGQYSRDSLHLEMGKSDIAREDMNSLVNALSLGLDQPLISLETAARMFLETAGVQDIEGELPRVMSLYEERKREEKELAQQQMQARQGTGAIANSTPSAARQRKNQARNETMRRAGTDKKVKSGTG
jgi:hypothetical protein